MEQKHRLLWADSQKGWLILLVILGHAIQTVMPADCNSDHVWNLIYSFHMPAFMAVSGWFAFRPGQGGGYGNTMKRRCWQLLVPYVAWSLILFALMGDYRAGQLANIVLRPDGYFWFLWVLFLINGIFLFGQWASRRLHVDELAVTGTMCLALFGVMVVFEVRVCGFQFLSYYFIFYTLGYCVHRFPWLQLRNRAAVAALFVAWAVLAWYWNMHELPAWMPAIPHVPASLLQYAYRGLTAAIAILVMFGWAPRALNGTGRVNLLVRKVGQVSLGLYVCHLTLMRYVVSIAAHAFPGLGTWPAVAVSFIVCTLLSVAIVEGLKRNKMTAKVLLGKI